MVIQTQKGNELRLKKILGKGGQGTVYFSDDERYLVKLISKGSNWTSSRLRNRLEAVRRMDLKGLPVARPLETLAPPHIGYVMEYASGMEALAALLAVPEKGFSHWYIVTGGIGRRLKLLHSLAGVMAKLHHRGIAYGDLSLTNVLVSPEQESHTVFLIDPDNLCQISNSHLRVYTPPFGAPELVRRKKWVSTYSDAWSFAVLAWQILTFVHPLIGDEFDNGPPENLEKCYSGEVPWICHPSDESNKCTRGLPPALTISEGMMELFDQTFRHGLNKPQERTTLKVWHDVLKKVLDRLIQCTACEELHLFSQEQMLCPFCDTAQRPPIRYFISHWETETQLSQEGVKLSELDFVRQKEQRQYMILGGNVQPITITRRHVLGDFTEKSDQELIEISPKGGGFEIVRSEGYYLRDLEAGFSRFIESSSWLSLEELPNTLIHFSPEDIPHQRGVMIKI